MNKATNAALAGDLAAVRVRIARGTRHPSNVVILQAKERIMASAFRHDSIALHRHACAMARLSIMADFRMRLLRVYAEAMT